MTHKYNIGVYLNLSSLPPYITTTTKTWIARNSSVLLMNPQGVINLPCRPCAGPTGVSEASRAAHAEPPAACQGQWCGQGWCPDSYTPSARRGWKSRRPDTCCWPAEVPDLRAATGQQPPGSSWPLWQPGRTGHPLCLLALPRP